MALLPARNILDGTALPVTSQMKTALGSLRDYCSDLLGTDSSNKAAARTALGAAASGANTDIVSLGAVTGVTATLADNTTRLATTAFVNAEIANDAPSKTGGGASGTWGVNITGNAATASNALGFNQFWQNMLGSRASNVTYTNGTGRPIFVAIACYGNGSSVTMTVQGASFDFSSATTTGARASLYVPVPAGATYILNPANLISITSWNELRT